MKLARNFYIHIGLIFLSGLIALFYLIHVENKRLLGEFLALSARLSTAQYEALVASHERYMLFGGLVIAALLALSLFFIFRRRVFSPLKSLGEGLKMIEPEKLGDRMCLDTDDESAEAARAFRAMTESHASIATDLEDSLRKYSSLLETASDAIVLVDVETMRVTEVNRAATHMTGYSMEELLEQTTPALYGPDEVSERYRASFKRWVYDGKGYMHDGSIRIKNNGTVAVEVAASTVELGGRGFVLEIWRDVTDRKNLEDNLMTQIKVLETRVRERTEKLEDALQRLKRSKQKMIQSTKLISLGEMGAGIAHELNSPLAGILTITEVLLGRMGKEDRSYGLLLKLKDAAVRSKYIIIDMLSYARPFKDEREPLNMNDVLRSTLSLFISEINAADLEIRLDLAKTLPMIHGGRGQLMEVMFNLIKNARDALDGYGSINLSTSLVEEDGLAGVAVDIRDTGPGIAAEVIDRVFDPFFSTKDKGGGLNIGLGLSISQSIIKEHGGVIRAKNLTGGGASFRVFIPALTDGPAGKAHEGDKSKA